jgi:hypothetical protein
MFLAGVFLFCCAVEFFFREIIEVEFGVIKSSFKHDKIRSNRVQLLRVQMLLKCKAHFKWITHEMMNRLNEM